VVLFEARFRDGVQDGSVTVTFRRWKRSQAVAGHRYRTAVGIIEVESVDVVDADAITDAEARRSGYPSAAAVAADLRGTDGHPVYRVRFHAVPGPDPRDELANDVALSDAEVAEIDRRLARLAAELGRERAPFKLDVRKLKNLGLTLSLDVGYRLSPRGQAYLERSGRAR
jgi:hypothetical protein